jgi:type I restriction enzyme S subunit
LAFASYLIRFRLLTQVVEPGWVVLVLSSPHWRQVLEGRAATTAGQYNLSIAKLSDVPIPLPPVEDQRAILSALRESESPLKKSDADIRAQQRLVAALRRALLQAAFGGHLVEQCGEEEPADLLLKSIVDARQAQRNAQRAANRTIRRARPNRAATSEETTA